MTDRSEEASREWTAADAERVAAMVRGSGDVFEAADLIFWLVVRVAELAARIAELEKGGDVAGERAKAAHDVGGESQQPETATTGTGAQRARLTPAPELEARPSVPASGTERDVEELRDRLVTHIAELETRVRIDRLVLASGQQNFRVRLILKAWDDGFVPKQDELESVFEFVRSALLSAPSPASPQDTQRNQMVELLYAAHAAVSEAIMSDDGLDGAKGDGLLLQIQKVLPHPQQLVRHSPSPDANESDADPCLWTGPHNVSECGWRIKSYCGLMGATSQEEDK